MMLGLVAASAMVVATPQATLVEDEAPRPSSKPAKRRVVSPMAPVRYRRSRNAPPKRKLRANRLHVSKRTRRKHRRAK